MSAVARVSVMSFVFSKELIGAERGKVAVSYAGCRFVLLVFSRRSVGCAAAQAHNCHPVVVVTAPCVKEVAVDAVPYIEYGMIL